MSQSATGTINQLQRLPVSGTREEASELARTELLDCRKRFGQAFIHHQRYEQPDAEWWKITLGRSEWSEILMVVMWHGGGR
jgi:hypothetical protein